MAANGVVLRQPAIGFSPSSSSLPCCSKEFRIKNSIFVGKGQPKLQVLGCGFRDQGHVEYYNNKNSDSGFMSIVKSGEKKDDEIIVINNNKKVKNLKKTKKKQLKLLKGLTRDLSTFNQIGFGLDLDKDLRVGGLVDHIKGNVISEAAELLLEQLQKLKAEEKQLKKKAKEEKKRALKASNTCEMSSSSSSSESSDSECGEVVDMKTLKGAQKNQSSSQQVIEVQEEEACPSYPAPIIPVIPSAVPLLQAGENECTNSSNAIEESGKALVSMNSSKKIEVCMGGKCKKSGAATLLDEFQRVVGIEGAVSGCKCMGKCRDGPNVKVLKEETLDSSSVKAAAMNNSLCIGVGLEDVRMIVANFFGDENNYSNQPQQFGFAAAASS